ncbi:MAG: DUF488 family protein [Muribaculaceae bacterium]|nr:DUF488 family protein [Muribaculaceae bacterium]
MTTILLKRAYDEPQPSDGFRILVDRLWPRGMSHATLPYSEWDKQLAPSDELRKWFHESPAERWALFSKKYSDELLANPAFSEFISEVKQHPVVTLLYGSHDTEHNNAVVLRDVAMSKLNQE